jgi:hypothetical protein
MHADPNGNIPGFVMDYVATSQPLQVARMVSILRGDEAFFRSLPPVSNATSMHPGLDWRRQAGVD